MLLIVLILLFHNNTAVKENIRNQDVIPPRETQKRGALGGKRDVMTGA